MRLIVILAVSLFLLPANLAAAGRTDQLLWKCNGTLPSEVDRIMGKMQCAGYLDGVLDTHRVLTFRSPRSRVFCIPKRGISIDQAIRVFVGWANNHPEELHNTARVSVLRALKEAFPCGRRG